jgi:hypothetical protein
LEAGFSQSGPDAAFKAAFTLIRLNLLRILADQRGLYAVPLLPLSASYFIRYFFRFNSARAERKRYCLSLAY